MSKKTEQRRRSMIRALSNDFQRVATDTVRAHRAAKREHNTWIGPDKPPDPGELVLANEVAVVEAAERFVSYCLEHPDALAELCQQPLAKTEKAMDAAIKQCGGDRVQLAYLLRATLKNASAKQKEHGRELAKSRCSELTWDGTVPSLRKCLAGARKAAADMLKLDGAAVDARKAQEVIAALPSDACVTILGALNVLEFEYREGRGRIRLRMFEDHQIGAEATVVSAARVAPASAIARAVTDNRLSVTRLAQSDEDLGDVSPTPAPDVSPAAARDTSQPGPSDGPGLEPPFVFSYEDDVMCRRECFRFATEPPSGIRAVLQGNRFKWRKRIGAFARPAGHPTDVERITGIFTRFYRDRHAGTPEVAPSRAPETGASSERPRRKATGGSELARSRRQPLRERDCPRCRDVARYRREQARYRRAMARAINRSEAESARAHKPEMKFPPAAPDCDRCEERFGRKRSAA